MLVAEASVDLVKWTLNISHHGSYLPRPKHPPLTHHAFCMPSLLAPFMFVSPLFSGMKWGVVVTPLGRQRQADLWGFLGVQLRLPGEYQASGKFCLKNKKN